FFGGANVADVINDVVGVFQQGIVGRTVERRAAAVVIDTQAAPDIDAFDRESHFVEFGIEPGGLLDGFFDGENIRDLRADVEMDQLETTGEVFRLEHLHGGEQFHG